MIVDAYQIPRAYNTPVSRRATIAERSSGTDSEQFKIFFTTAALKQKLQNTTTDVLQTRLFVGGTSAFCQIPQTTLLKTVEEKPTPTSDLAVLESIYVLHNQTATLIRTKGITASGDVHVVFAVRNLTLLSRQFNLWGDLGDTLQQVDAVMRPSPSTGETVLTGGWYQDHEVWRALQLYFSMLERDPQKSHQHQTFAQNVQHQFQQCAYVLGDAAIPFMPQSLFAVRFTETPLTAGLNTAHPVYPMIQALTQQSPKLTVIKNPTQGFTLTELLDTCAITDTRFTMSLFNNIDPFVDATVAVEDLDEQHQRGYYHRIKPTQDPLWYEQIHVEVSKLASLLLSMDQFENTRIATIIKTNTDEVLVLYGDTHHRVHTVVYLDIVALSLCSYGLCFNKTGPYLTQQPQRLLL